MKSGAVIGVGLAVFLVVGCAKTIREEAFPALFKSGVQVTKLAVAPFVPGGELLRRSADDFGTSPSVASAIVARNVSEQLAARGFQVIPADDVRRALGVEDSARQEIAPALLSSIVADRFGADGLLLGRVVRYQDRKGRAMGSTRPAAVGFVVTLFKVPGAEKLWEGVFNETQRDLSSNVLNAGRYPGGGTRWLTADEMARWGAEEIAYSMPFQPR